MLSTLCHLYDTLSFLYFIAPTFHSLFQSLTLFIIESSFFSYLTVFYFFHVLALHPPTFLPLLFSSLSGYSPSPFIIPRHDWVSPRDLPLAFIPHTFALSPPNSLSTFYLHPEHNLPSMYFFLLLVRVSYRSIFFDALLTLLMSLPCVVIIITLNFPSTQFPLHIFLLSS